MVVFVQCETICEFVVSIFNALQAIQNLITIFLKAIRRSETTRSNWRIYDHTPIIQIHYLPQPNHLPIMWQCQKLPPICFGRKLVNFVS